MHQRFHYYQKYVFYLTLKNCFCDYQNEMADYYENQKIQHFLQSHYQNSTNLAHEMVFHIHSTHNFLSLAFTRLAAPNKQFFNVKFLKGIFDQLSKS